MNRDNISTAIIALQTPLIPKNIGRTIIQEPSKTKVRRVEIIAEIIPLFKAVKNDDANKLKPTSKKEIEYTLKP